ncbi:hypothetical protein [Ferdinandcohnia sp. SAFN-114]
MSVQKEDEKDRVDKNATSCGIVDTSTSCALKVRGGAALSSGTYAINTSA